MYDRHAEVQTGFLGAPARFDVTDQTQSLAIGFANN